MKSGTQTVMTARNAGGRNSTGVLRSSNVNHDNESSDHVGID